MKKSFVFTTLAFLGVLGFVGCNKENAKDVVPGSLVNFTINADAPATRTYIVYDANAKTYTPYWHGGDQLGVFFNSWAENDAVQATFQNTLSDGPTASFSGQGTVGSAEQTIYAFYPASSFAKAYNSSVLGFTIP